MPPSLGATLRAAYAVQIIRTDDLSFVASSIATRNHVLETLLIQSLNAAPLAARVHCRPGVTTSPARPSSLAAIAPRIPAIPRAGDYPAPPAASAAITDQGATAIPTVAQACAQRQTAGWGAAPPHISPPHRCRLREGGVHTIFVLLTKNKVS